MGRVARALLRVRKDAPMLGARLKKVGFGLNNKRCRVWGRAALLLLRAHEVPGWSWYCTASGVFKGAIIVLMRGMN